MLFLFTALYPEASSLIKALGLKRKETDYGWMCFAGEDILLTVTGTGQLKAAYTASSILTMFNAKREDSVLWFGSAASLKKEPGTLFVIHKITSLETGHSLYPDMLYDFSITEGSALSSEKLMTAGNVDMHGYDVYDMESYGFASAVMKMLGPSALVILRVVSDSDSQTMTKEALQKICESCLEDVLKVISILRETKEEQKRMFTEEEEERIALFAERLHCTEAMKRELLQYVRYAQCAGIDWLSLMETYTEEIQEKEEGKKVLKAYEQKIAA